MWVLTSYYMHKATKRPRAPVSIYVAVVTEVLFEGPGLAGNG